MKILGVYMQNFGPFWGRHYIPLCDRGLVSVLGENLDDPRTDSNGSGKSTALSDSIDWCFWGDPPRRQSAGAVVNDLSQGECCVTVLVSTDDGHLLQVTRLRDWPKLGSGPRLYVDGEDRTTLDASETQKLINRALGMDRDVGHAVCLFAQEDDWNFADATDGERKEILAKIIPELGEVDRAHERVCGMLAEAAEAATLVQMEATRERSHLDSLRTQDSSTMAAVQQWEVWREQQVADLERSALSLEAKVSAVVVPEVTGAPMPNPTMHPLPQGLQEAVKAEEQVASGMRTQVDNLRHDAKRIRNEEARMRAQRSGKCSQCGTQVTDSHIAGEIQRLQAEYEVVCAQGQAASDQLTAAEQRLNHARSQVQMHEGSIRAEWQVRMVEVARHNSELQAQAGARASAQRMVSGLVSDAKAYRERAALQRVQENPEIVKRYHWEEAVRVAEQVCAARDSAQHGAEHRIRLLAYWKAGLGQKGLKSYVLDGKVGEMSAEVNRWVGLLTAGRTTIRIETQRESGKGKQKKYLDELSIRVIRSNSNGTITEREYRALSGGQKYRVAIGIAFGLARLVAKRATRSYDLLILDEVFRHLDHSGKDAVVEMLTELAKEKSSVFVIDHDPHIQHMVHDVLRVRLQGQRSTVVDGMHLPVSSVAEARQAAASGSGGPLAVNAAFPDPEAA